MFFLRGKKGRKSKKVGLRARFQIKIKIPFGEKIFFKDFCEYSSAFAILPQKVGKGRKMSVKKWDFTPLKLSKTDL